MSTCNWKPVPINEYKDFYSISDDGMVYSKHSKKVLKPKLSSAGYYRVTLCNGESHRVVSIHRLVAEAFVPNPNNKPTVNHKNEIKTDNRVENLEWATTAEQNSYGTRIQRAVSNTDWEKRNRKIDFYATALKRDYTREDMCNRKKTMVYKGQTLIGKYPTQREAGAAVGVSPSRVSDCVNGKISDAKGYLFVRVGD